MIIKKAPTRGCLTIQGVKMKDNSHKTFLCRYNYNGATYSIEIQARSFYEAKQRLKAIGINGKVDGIKVISIPIPNFLVKVILFFQKLISSRKK